MNDSEIFDFLAFGLSHHEGTVEKKVSKKFIGKPTKALRPLLENSVKRYKRDDCCLMLSGGIDSSAIECLTGVDAFTASFHGSGMDELRYARLATKKGGGKLVIVKPTPNSIMARLDEQLAEQGPLASLGVCAQYQVMEAAAYSGFKTILSGNGPDELLGGYLPYFGAYLKTLLGNGYYQDTLTEMCGAMFNMKLTKPWHFTSMLSNLAPDTLKAYLATKRLARLINPDFTRYANQYNYERLKTGSFSELLENDLNIATVPQIGHYEDTAAKAWGLKCVRPFLSQPIVDYCTKLPMNQKIRGGVTKYCFRKAMEGIVPTEILTRKDKIGFTSPERWLMRVSY